MSLSNVTFGYYANNSFNGILRTSPGDELKAAEQISIDFTPPAVDRAEKVDCTIIFWNAAGEPFGFFGAYELDPGVPQQVIINMAQFVGGPTYNSAPGLSRIKIESMYYYIPDPYEDILIQEGYDFWDWYRDAPEGVTFLPARVFV